MGHNSTLTTKGDSVQPPGADGPVTWLSAAFQTLVLNIILPGQSFDVIKAIQLDDLAITMQEQDQTFAPPVSSKNTVAQYANPFGFHCKQWKRLRNSFSMCKAKMLQR